MTIHKLFVLLESEIFVVSSFILIVRILVSISFLYKHPREILSHVFLPEPPGEIDTTREPPNHMQVYQYYKEALEKNLLSSPLLLLLTFLSGGALMLWG